MLRQIRHMAKLARAARVIARHGGFDAALEDPQVPAPAKTALRLIGAGKQGKRARTQALPRRLKSWGQAISSWGSFLPRGPTSSDLNAQKACASCRIAWRRLP
jgi:hypothetical protein